MIRKTNTIKTKPKLSEQMKRKIAKQKAIPKVEREYDGDFTHSISTGSTLLDLAISGGRKRGGGLPGGIFVEVSGLESTGKTVLLCEIAGNIQSDGGESLFRDPEGRLNKQFARMFGVDFEKLDYDTCNTVTELFKAVREWEPKNVKIINGIFADSLAALSTDMEMEKEEGDKMGGRRAKEFSEGFRKVARQILDNNYLWVSSNQLRENMNPTFGQSKYDSPGGRGIKFYSSLRLRTRLIKELRDERKFAGKVVKKPIGIRTEVKVIKSSVWKPGNVAPITILYDYGIDDIRENLQFIKDYTKNTMYMVGSRKLSQSMDESITMIEEENLENQLREEVIDLWEYIDEQFVIKRKSKH